MGIEEFLFSPSMHFQTSLYFEISTKRFEIRVYLDSMVNTDVNILSPADLQ